MADLIAGNKGVVGELRAKLLELHRPARYVHGIFCHSCVKDLWPCPTAELLDYDAPSG